MVRACVGIVVLCSFSASHSKHTLTQSVRKVLLLIVVELVMLYAAAAKLLAPNLILTHAAAAANADAHWELFDRLICVQ